MKKELSYVPISHLDELMNKNKAIYLNLKEKLQGITIANEQIHRNINAIHSYSSEYRSNETQNDKPLISHLQKNHTNKINNIHSLKKYPFVYKNQLQKITTECKETNIQPRKKLFQTNRKQQRSKVTEQNFLIVKQYQNNEKPSSLFIIDSPSKRYKVDLALISQQQIETPTLHHQRVQRKRKIFSKNNSPIKQNKSQKKKNLYHQFQQNKQINNSFQYKNFSKQQFFQKSAIFQQKRQRSHSLNAQYYIQNRKKNQQFKTNKCHFYLPIQQKKIDQIKQSQQLVKSQCFPFKNNKDQFIYINQIQDSQISNSVKQPSYYKIRQQQNLSSSNHLIKKQLEKQQFLKKSQISLNTNQAQFTKKNINLSEISKKNAQKNVLQEFSKISNQKSDKSKISSQIIQKQETNFKNNYLINKPLTQKNNKIYLTSTQQSNIQPIYAKCLMSKTSELQQNNPSFNECMLIDQNSHATSTFKSTNTLFEQQNDFNKNELQNDTKQQLFKINQQKYKKEKNLQLTTNDQQINQFAYTTINNASIVQKNTAKCCVYIPFNKLYHSPIIQLRRGAIFLRRQSKTMDIAPSVQDRGTIFDSIKYKIHSITDEQILINSLFYQDANVQINEALSVPIQLKIACIGFNHTNKKKIHSNLLQHAFAHVCRIVLEHNYYSNKLHCSINHHQKQEILGQFQIKADCQEIKLMEMEKFIQQINLHMNRQNKNFIKNEKYQRVTKISLHSNHQLRFNIQIISTNIMEEKILNKFKEFKVCFSVNPLSKNYRDVKETLQKCKMFCKKFMPMSKCN